MKIEFNETTQTLHIEDGLKKQYLVLKFLLIINLLNATIFFLKAWKTALIF